jgi:hypothetical protein
MISGAATLQNLAKSLEAMSIRVETRSTVVRA